MPELLGHLEIGSSCGGCMTELVSNCRTIGHLNDIACCSDDAGCAGMWTINQDCEDCCCGSIDPGEGIQDAPWYDPNVPASTDFLGLYGTLELASPPIQTTVSASGSSTAAVPKQLTFLGAIVAKSKAGVVFGEQWIERQLLPDCPACSGRPVRFFLHCADLADEIDPPQVGQQIPDPLVGWEDPCAPGEPELLLPAPVPIRFDNGARDLLRVRYNPGSFSKLPDDPATSIPTCAGKRVTFSFTVLESFQYLDPMDACRIDGETHKFDCCYCVPLGWETPAGEPVVVGKPGCLPSSLPTITTLDAAAPRITDDARAGCLWSAPLSTQRVSCLTPYFAGDEADLVVTINSGDAGACNVAVTFWEAATGWPNPTHPNGRITYPIEAAAGRAEIAYAEPGRDIVLDGRTSLGTDGVTGCGGGVFRQPAVPCNRRMWVAVDFDCANPPGEGWSISVSLHPRERVVG